MAFQQRAPLRAPSIAAGNGSTITIKAPSSAIALVMPRDRGAIGEKKTTTNTALQEKKTITIYHNSRDNYTKTHMFIYT